MSLPLRRSEQEPQPPLSVVAREHASQPSARAPRPTATPSGTSIDGFILFWSLFQLTVWAMDALWVSPRLLDYVGLPSFAIWMQHHAWVHWLAAPPLFLLTVLSFFTPIDKTKQQAESSGLAARFGATVEMHRKLDPVHGLPTAPGFRIPLRGGSMSIGWWSGHDREARTVARVFVGLQGAFSFAARAASRDPALLRGVQQSVMKQALEQAADRSADAQSQAALAAMAYLGGPPIVTGHEWLDRTIVLRADRPDTASAMFSSPEMITALRALDTRTQLWAWTLTPSTREGLAELQLELPGSRKDEESIQMTVDAMQAALESMSRAGLLRDTSH